MVSESFKILFLEGFLNKLAEINKKKKKPSNTIPFGSQSRGTPQVLNKDRTPYLYQVNGTVN